MRIFATLILLCLPAMSFAQKVAVRSGEHADFSRLAFAFSNPIEWEMGRIENGYEIRLRGTRSEIDISEVYHRIPRDRIKSLSVSKDNTRITLDLGCDCHADAFEFRSGLLVIDVKEGPPSATSRFEDSFSSGELIIGQHMDSEELEKVERAPAEDKPSVKLPLRTTQSQNFNKPNISVFGKSSEEVVQKPTQQVAEMQSEILRQIGHAASQGLLNANAPQPVHIESYNPISTQTIVKPLPARIAKPHININIESSIAREFSDLARKYLKTSSGRKCLSKTLFTIAEWGDEESILAKVSEHRSTLLGEFDTVDAQKVHGLVRAYIYAGFGAEALAVLSSFGVTLKDENSLKTMAHIVDGTTPDHYGEFADQLSCDSTSALWAAFATPSLSKQGKINSTAILSAFSGLPIHLRRLLGPNLAQKFLAVGDVETAHALRNAIARAPGDSGSEFHLLDAKLDLERGLKDSAEQTLEDIVASDKVEAPSALIELLELRLQNREDVTPKTLATAESYIFEQHDTKVSANLKRLIALSLAQSGDFTGALSALNELEVFKNLDTHTKVMTWGKVVEYLTLEASEATLLKFIFATQNELSHQNISREIRRKLAVRLVEDGWPVEAEMILAAPTSPTADDRVILAQSGILKGQTEYVLRMLENVAGGEAANLRASAYENMGDYSAAAQEYRILNDGENQKIAVWRAKDWAQLIEIGTEVDQAAAKVMLRQDHNGSGAASSVNGMIAYDSSLLAKSKEERQSIEALLEKHSILVQEEP